LDCNTIETESIDADNNMASKRQEVRTSYDPSLGVYWNDHIQASGEYVVRLSGISSIRQTRKCGASDRSLT
jgi:hypothetical protein